MEKYEHLANKLLNKEKNSRQYNAIVNRMKKFIKKEIHYREVRLRDKSLEYLEKFRKNMI